MKNKSPLGGDDSQPVAMRFRIPSLPITQQQI